MAIIWADFPSGQRGLYGTNAAKMLDGVWGEANFTSLVADPDPAITTGGIVLSLGGAIGGTSNAMIGPRFAYPTPAKTQGLSIRLWLSSLPSSSNYTPVISFKDGGNTSFICMRVLTTGAIEFRSTHTNGGTLYGTTTGPVLTANAYNHIEMKVFSNAATGTIELRINGQVKLNLTGLNTNGADIAQVQVGENSDATGSHFQWPYYKDIVLWDTSGTEANDFQGSVSVYDLFADADVSLNWTPSTGALGYPLITDNFPANTLTATGAISDGEVVRIDNTYYRFSTAGTVDAGAPAGTAANPWRVSLGVSVAIALSNLFNAIGATGVAGVDYSTALVAHTTVDANGFTATAVSVTAKIATASAIVTTETGANLAWVSGTLVLGPTDPSYISADATPPAAAVFTMTNLPSDVVSVRALLPLFRAQKTDGGDCNVQAGLSPDNVTWVNGADEPMTVAQTYYWSVIHINPDTAAPWTPGEVNGAYVRVDRTI